VQLVARNIYKSFGATRALDDVSITFEAGQVRALVGENGAGKSTLLKVLAANIHPDKGTIVLDGQPYTPNDMREAERNGVALVFQEITVNPSLTIAENIFIDRLREFQGFAGLIDWKRLNAAAQHILDGMGVNFTVQRDLHDLNLGQWKIIEIARALSYQPKVLFLDESTAFLSTQEVNAFLTAVRNLRERGIAIGFVSHHLDEVQKVADTLTVLKDGKWVGDYAVGQIRTVEIEALMVGREIGSGIYPEKRACASDEVLLKLDHVSVPGELHDVSFELCRGEILGIGGLKGSGGEAILEVILGDQHAGSGRISFEGREFRPRRPYDAWDRGIAYLPGDRTGEGLIVDFTVMENVSMAAMPRNGPFLNKRSARTLTEKYIADLFIKAQGPNVACNSLSGGNLQKVVLAKCMAPAPRLLLLNNPTRGIDVGARMEIYRIIRELANEGVSVILLSEDLPELIGLSNRILITRTGAVSRIFTTDERPREQEIINHMI
jgi:ribose transport system ATP-binding protein